MSQKIKDDIEQFPWPTVFLSVITLVLITVAFKFLPVTQPINQLNDLIHKSGLFGPIIFITILALTVIIPPLPERPIILSAGIFFNPFIGAFLSIFGATLGASVNFAIARKFGRRYINSKPSLNDYLKRSEALGSFAAIVLIRTFAGFTFDWYSYLVGLLKTKLFVYVVGTFLGITTGTFLEVYAGSFLLKNPYITLVLGLISIFISLVAYKISPKLRSYSNKLVVFSKYQATTRNDKHHKP